MNFQRAQKRYIKKQAKALKNRSNIFLSDFRKGLQSSVVILTPQGLGSFGV